MNRTNSGRNREKWKPWTILTRVLIRALMTEERVIRRESLGNFRQTGSRKRARRANGPLMRRMKAAIRPKRMPRELFSSRGTAFRLNRQARGVARRLNRREWEAPAPEVKRIEAPEEIAGELEELKRLNPAAAELALEDSPEGESIRAPSDRIRGAWSAGQGGEHS